MYTRFIYGIAIWGKKQSRHTSKEAFIFHSQQYYRYTTTRTEQNREEEMRSEVFYNKRYYTYNDIRTY